MPAIRGVVQEKVGADDGEDRRNIQANEMARGTEIAHLLLHISLPAHAFTGRHIFTSSLLGAVALLLSEEAVDEVADHLRSSSLLSISTYLKREPHACFISGTKTR
jgi:hypothetical protein